MAEQLPSLQEELKTKFQFTEEQIALFATIADQMQAGDQMHQILARMAPAEVMVVVKIASSAAQVMADSNVGCVEFKELHSVMQTASEQFQEVYQGGDVDEAKLNQLVVDAIAVNYDTIRENDHGPKWKFEANQ